MTAPAVDVPEYSSNGGVASVVTQPAWAVKSTVTGGGVPGRWSVNSRTRVLVFDVIRTAIVVPAGTSPIDNVVSQYPPAVAVVSATPQSLPTRIAEPGWAVPKNPCVIGVFADPLAPRFAVNSITAGAAVVGVGSAPGRSNENSRTRSLVLDVIRTPTFVPGGTSRIVSVAAHLPSASAVVSPSPYGEARWISEPGLALP